MTLTVLELFGLMAAAALIGAFVALVVTRAWYESSSDGSAKR